jgi:hypothetical protein
MNFHQLKLQNGHSPSLDGILTKSNTGLLILYPIGGWNIKMLISGPLIESSIMCRRCS